MENDFRFHFHFKWFLALENRRERERKSKKIALSEQEYNQIALEQDDRTAPIVQTHPRRTQSLIIEIVSPFPDSDAQRENPKNPRSSSFVEQCPNPFVKPRKPIRSHHLRPSLRRSHHRRDRRYPPKTDHSRRTPKPIVLNLASSSSTQIRHRRPRFIVPIHRTQSPLSLSLSIWPDLMNFFCWDLFFLCLFTEKWY